MKKTVPKVLIRVESFFIFILALFAFFFVYEGNWILLVILILAPDLSFFAYFGGKEVGASVYNAFHSYVGPLILMVISLYYGNTLATQISMIWFAHIGADRTAGYGLKYTDSFKVTHLQKI